MSRYICDEKNVLAGIYARPSVCNWKLVLAFLFSIFIMLFLEEFFCNLKFSEGLASCTWAMPGFSSLSQRLLLSLRCGHRCRANRRRGAWILQWRLPTPWPVSSFWKLVKDYTNMFTWCLHGRKSQQILYSRDYNDLVCYICDEKNVMAGMFARAFPSIIGI